MTEINARWTEDSSPPSFCSVWPSRSPAVAFFDMVPVAHSGAVTFSTEASFPAAGDSFAYVPMGFALCYGD